MGVSKVDGSQALCSQKYAFLAVGIEEDQTYQDVEKWPGVSGGVVYEGMIKSWLTEDKVTALPNTLPNLTPSLYRMWQNTYFFLKRNVVMI